MDDLKLIKKHYGEDMAHLCRELFPSLLETEGLLFGLLKDNFQYSKFLYADILEYDLKNCFQKYIYGLCGANIKEDIEVNKNPYELMKEVGYTLYKCETEEDIQKFKNYYRDGEELCTFRGGRLNSCDVFFAVKDNADELKREDFKNPEREDNYGTSVISIQFNKSNHYLSIKNRYNHTVNNPDATFGNRLDNIIPGLAVSFNKFFGYKTTKGSSFIRDLTAYNYIQDENGKFYQYNYQMDTKGPDIYFCLGNVIIYNGKVLSEFLDKNRYLVFDYYVLDLKEKKILEIIELGSNNDYEVEDTLPEVINDLNVDKIEILKIENGKKDIVFIKDNRKIVITIDMLNSVIKYYDEINEELPDWYLYDNKYIDEIELVNTSFIGDWFGCGAYCVKKIKAPKLKKVGDKFLQVSDTEIARFPLLEEVGNGFMIYYVGKTANFPSLKSVGNDFLRASKVTKINFPNLETAGAHFLHDSSLVSVNLPKLKSLGTGGFWNGPKINTFIAPNLRFLSQYFITPASKNFKTLVIGSNDQQLLSEIVNRYDSLETINGKSADYYRKIEPVKRKKLER